MDEKDIDSLINKMDIPPSGGDAKARAKQAAWMRLQQAQANKRRWRLPSFVWRLSSFVTAPFGNPLAAGIVPCLVLFVFLSYSVTQSSRSGGGDAGSESNLVNSASVTQYPAGLRTSMIRMMVSGGVSADAISFDTPADFAANLTTPQLEAAAVFHPSGGGASPGLGPADIMADKTQHPWHYNAEFEVENIGKSVAKNADGNEITAFLAHLSDSICKRINEQLGITTADASGIPEYAIRAAAYDIDKKARNTIPATEQVLDTELSGQPFGCFKDTTPATPVNVYYHVLIER